jgi:hypothetical protein
VLEFERATSNDSETVSRRSCPLPRLERRSSRNSSNKKRLRSAGKKMHYGQRKLKRRKLLLKRRRRRLLRLVRRRRRPTHVLEPDGRPWHANKGRRSRKSGKQSARRGGNLWWRTPLVVRAPTTAHSRESRQKQQLKRKQRLPSSTDRMKSSCRSWSGRKGRRQLRRIVAEWRDQHPLCSLTLPLLSVTRSQAAPPSSGETLVLILMTTDTLRPLLVPMGRGQATGVQGVTPMALPCIRMGLP